VIPGRREATQLSSVPTSDLTGADVIITSGAAAARPPRSAALPRTAGVKSACVESAATRLTSRPIQRRRQHRGRDEVRSTTRGSSRCRPTTVINSAGQFRLSTTRDVYDYFRNPDGTPTLPPARCGHRRGSTSLHRFRSDRSLQREDDRVEACSMVTLCRAGRLVPKEVEAAEGPDSTRSTGSGTSTREPHRPTTETTDPRRRLSGTVPVRATRAERMGQQAPSRRPHSEYWCRRGKCHVGVGCRRRGIQPVVHPR